MRTQQLPDAVHLTKISSSEGPPVRVTLIKLGQRCITGQALQHGTPQCSQLGKHRAIGRRLGLPLMHQWNKASCKGGSQVQVGVCHVTQQQVMQQHHQLMYQMVVQTPCAVL